MSAAWRRRVWFQFLVALWAMLTVVLVFCIVLLARELGRQDSKPAAAATPAQERATPAPAETAEAVKDVTLYFADAQARALVADPAQIPMGGSTVENCRRALDALIRGPHGRGTPILPATAHVRGVYLLEDGELIADFSMELGTELRRIDSASLESLMIYGIVNTLAQPAIQGTNEVSVTKVRLLIEGAAPRETFPAHLDVSRPIGPDPGWIAHEGA